MRVLPMAVVAGAAITALSSCDRPESDVDRGPVRRVYSFEGKMEPRFVGEWHTSPEPSMLNLRKDGTVGIVAVTMSPSGKDTTELKGDWRVSGTDLLLRYARSPEDPPIVLKYAATLEGDTLRLVQAGNGVKSTYRRRSKR